MSIPREQTFDASLALWNEGYLFITNRCSRFSSDSFHTRLMLKPVLCAQGAEAAELVYGTDMFTRRGAMPSTVLKLLQDEGSVQQLDGHSHRHRKAMFMEILTGDNVDRLRSSFRETWLRTLPLWREKGRIRLMDEAQKVLLFAVAEWAGFPLAAEETATLTFAFADMVEESGGIGWGHWRARMERHFVEQRVRSIIEAVRSGGIDLPDDSPLATISRFKDDDGHLLPIEVATVELINIIRPTVAIAWYIVFAALALHDHPEVAARIADGDDDVVEPFVTEVRRFYPFFPFIGGVARTGFDWRGERFDEGQWVLLDLHGTNRDPRVWLHADTFEPGRFADGDDAAGPFSFVPQGGGDHASGHRCPGEWVTQDLVAEAVRILTREMTYAVPDQDLRVSTSSMPTQPKSGFEIHFADI